MRVYHGSVGRFQSQVRVTAQLTACPEGNRLWGGTESYDATDLNAAQEKIARWVLSTSQGHLFLTSPAIPCEEYLRRRTPADNKRGLELAREAWRNGRSSQVGVDPDQPASCRPSSKDGPTPLRARSKRWSTWPAQC